MAKIFSERMIKLNNCEVIRVAKYINTFKSIIIENSDANRKSFVPF